MSKHLVIVESPAKARTIKRYLGKDHDVLASYGHVRDLVPKGGAVDPEHGFTMKYQLIAKNSKHVKAIEKAARQADDLYLATDPDREGEAISWHVCNVLEERGVLSGKRVHRVVFHEITRNAVREAMASPRTLSESLINAQQARRALDYLVGFNLSPLAVEERSGRGLSAGRVQSPALRLIAEREDEIVAFEPREYWSIAARSRGQGSRPGKAQTIQARLAPLRRREGRAVHLHERRPPCVEAEEEIRQRGRRRYSHRSQGGQETAASAIPAAPFTTSTLQQEAARKLRFSAQKTMSDSATPLRGQGLITYMRTDSVTLSRGRHRPIAIAHTGALWGRQPAAKPSSLSHQGKERPGGP